MKNSLRIATFATLVAASLSANAAVTYTFSGTGQFNDHYAFSLTTNQFITKNTLFNDSQFTSETGTNRAFFDTAPSFTGPAPFITTYPGPGYGAEDFFFAPGAFKADGVYQSHYDNVGTLTVSGTPNAPGPASCVPMVVGIAGLMRRRLKCRKEGSFR